MTEPIPRMSALSWRRLLIEPARPERVRRWPGAPWLVVGTVCIGAFMGQLDASIVTLAVPSIQADLHASLATVEWVALSYLLVLVATVSAVGRLADMFGRKLLYTYGFVVFTAASVGCGFAPTLPWLLAGRVVQAVGAAMLQANSVALIRTNVPASKLGRAIGLQGAAQAIGLALGPTVGGMLIAAGGWRWVFWVNLPAGIVGSVLGWLLLPRTRARATRARFDWRGLALLAVAACALLWGFSRAGGSGFGSLLVIAALVAAAALFAAFAWAQLRTAAPLVDLGLFRARGFRVGIGSGLLGYLVLFGVLFVIPLYLEYAHHLSPGRAGLLLTILPLVLGVAAPVAGLAADRVGPRPPTVGGLLIATGGAALLAAGPATVSVTAVALGLLGLGLGLFVPANNATVAGAGLAEQAGMVSGVLNMTRGIGTSLGVALAGAAYALAAGVAGSQLADSTQAVAGLRAAAVLLAAVALAGAVVATRGGERPARGPGWAEM